MRPHGRSDSVPPVNIRPPWGELGEKVPKLQMLEVSGEHTCPPLICVDGLEETGELGTSASGGGDGGEGVMVGGTRCLSGD